MHIINVTVRDKIATHVGDVYYVCGNSDFVVHFDFDDEWAALDVKTARFICEDGSFRNQVFSGSECPVPIISNTNSLRVGVFAGNLCTTTPARVPAAKSILCPGGMPAAPEDDAYHQVMEEMAKVGHEARSSAEASAQSAQEAATSAQEAAQAAASAGTYLDNVDANAKAATAAAQAAKQSETAAAASADSAEKAKETAITNADDAEEAAKSAQASARTAGTLATQAETSAQNAAASAKAAKQSETAAGNSAQAAATSAQAAKQSETAAAAAAQTAGTDATASAQNAQAAATSAQAAKQSETAAAAAAQTAGTDATASARNAQAAAVSASSAATSADNAAASAQAAQESAKVVEQSDWVGKVYVVTTSYNDAGQVIADRSPRDIERAFSNGMTPLLLDGSTGMWFIGFEDYEGESCPAFYAWSEYDAESGAVQNKAYITSDCVVYMTGTFTRIPNPAALTIGGVAYDGSKAVSVDIPDVYVVTISSGDGGYVADHTYKEIIEAIGEGKACMAYLAPARTLYPISAVKGVDATLQFGLVEYDDYNSVLHNNYITITKDNVIKYNGGTVVTYPPRQPSSDVKYLRWNGTAWEAATIAQLKSDLGLT